MAVLGDATIARLRKLPYRLAYPDYCEIIASVGSGVDEFGNTAPSTPAVIEAGMCALRKGGLQPQERIIADRLGWTTPMVIDLPYATLAASEHRIRVNGDRTFEIGGVVKEGRWGLQATAVCTEQG